MLPASNTAKNIRVPTTKVWEKENVIVKKFNKRQLIDQLGFSAEEVQIVLEYQKRLPVLLDDDGLSGFCINARDLWEQLGKPHAHFAHWTNRKLVHKKNKNGSYLFIEKLDYIGFGQKSEKPIGGRPTQEYYLTLDCAKNLAMMENTDAGALCRNYFILMERACKDNEIWERIRQPQKADYNKLVEAISAYVRRNFNREADKYDFTKEADTLNVIATGSKAQSIRNLVGCPDNITRDSLIVDYNQYLWELEKLDIVYLGMDMPAPQRYEMLKKSFQILYPNAVPLKDNVEVCVIISSKVNFTYNSAQDNVPALL